MILKKYRCKLCGSQEFFLAEDAMPIGIYCDNCGRWLKWANKDERNLFLKLRLNASYGRIAQGEFKK